MQPNPINTDALLGFAGMDTNRAESAQQFNFDAPVENKPADPAPAEQPSQPAPAQNNAAPVDQNLLDFM